MKMKSSLIKVFYFASHKFLLQEVAAVVVVTVVAVVFAVVHGAAAVGNCRFF